MEIELQRIAPNPEQPRLRFDDTALEALAESIRQHGLLQPVVVSQVDDDEGLPVDRRRAALAGGTAGRLRTIPALVKEAAPRARLELALVENVQREDLAPLELAVAYRALIEESRSHPGAGGPAGWQEPGGRDKHDPAARAPPAGSGGAGGRPDQRRASPGAARHAERGRAPERAGDSVGRAPDGPPTEELVRHAAREPVDVQNNDGPGAPLTATPRAPSGALLPPTPPTWRSGFASAWGPRFSSCVGGVGAAWCCISSPKRSSRASTNCSVATSWIESNV